jgi:hypothetical protein
MVIYTIVVGSIYIRHSGDEVVVTIGPTYHMTIIKLTLSPVQVSNSASSDDDGRMIIIVDTLSSITGDKEFITINTVYDLTMIT